MFPLSSPEAPTLAHALSRLKLMYAKPEHPYYINAPDYRETSSGVVSLHYLCHLLNLSGREAYVCGAKTVNPDLKTPLLDAVTAQRHQRSGKVPIAVYPEVVAGNPLDCSVVCRFLLNFEGFLTGQGMQARSNDLLFYSGALIATRHGNPDGDVLCLPTIDVSLFHAASSTEVRQGRYLYQNRHPLGRIDYSLLPGDIRLLSMADPIGLPELAGLLRRAEVMYTYEWSMTCVMAVMCGCPVIFMPGHGIDRQFLKDSFVGDCGFAMLDEPDAVGVARASVEGALERYVERIAPFWQQFDVFIEKSQDRARREEAGNRSGALQWLRQRYPLPAQLSAMRAHLDRPDAPAIAVIVRDHGDALALRRTLDSADESLYQKLQVCVLGPKDPARANVQWLPGDLAKQANTLNDWLETTPSDWLVMLDAGDELTTSGLLVAALDLLQAPETCLALYLDQAWREADGAVELDFRPDLDLDLLLSDPERYAARWLFHCGVVLQCGGFSTDVSAFELEFQLRLIGGEGLRCIGHVSEPLVISERSVHSGCDDRQEVICAHLEARGYPHAHLLELPGSPERYRLSYGNHESVSVSVMIQLEGSILNVQSTLERVLDAVAGTDLTIVLIDAGDADPHMLQWLQLAVQAGQGRVEVLRFPFGIGRAAIFNEVARSTQSDYLLWLEAGAQPLDSDWLPALLEQASRPEVGVVGAMLVDRHDQVVEAGLLLGGEGTVSSAFAGLPISQANQGQRMLERGCSAVSLRCLMIRRQLFLEHGGLDESPEMAPWVDVDLCLRLKAAGLLTLCVARVSICVEQARPRVMTEPQYNALLKFWLPALANDPSYNSNLSLRRGHAFVAEDNGLVWRPLRGLQPTVVALVSDSGPDAQSRIIHPLAAARDAALVDGAVTATGLGAVDIVRIGAQSVVVHGVPNVTTVSLLSTLSACTAVFKVLDLQGCVTDLGQVDWDTLPSALREGLQWVDRVVVGSMALAHVLQQGHPDVRVVESGLPLTWRSLNGVRGAGGKVRVGMLGHVDLTLLEPVVLALQTDVQWVVLGDCPPSLRAYIDEVHPAVSTAQLGGHLAALNLDLALVPSAGSSSAAYGADLRALQHAACGQTVVCSRMPGLVGADSLPLSKAENDPADWIRVIRLHLDDHAASLAMGQAQQAAVRSDWILEGKRLAQWCDAWGVGGIG